MNLNKAVEIGTVMAKEQVYLLTPDGGDALKLLIEAGKRIQQNRCDFFTPAITPLPGETEDCCKLCGAIHTGIECPSREGEK